MNTLLPVSLVFAASFALAFVQLWTLTDLSVVIEDLADALSNTAHRFAPDSMIGMQIGEALRRAGRQ